MPVANTLEDLIRLMDEGERIKETNEKMKIVKTQYQVQQSIDEYRELIAEIKNRTSRPTDPVNSDLRS
jgi:hypothetical protein